MIGKRPHRGARGARLWLAAALVAAGASAAGIALADQAHAPQPTPAQAGSLGPPAGVAASAALERAEASFRRAAGPVMAPARPIRLSIPSIGVDTALGEVGRNPNGTIQVPPLYRRPSEAAWYRDSPAPGATGPSVIVGHVDDVDGPAVFFRLGALAPGDRIRVERAGGTVATFRVDGVRRYAKDRFPTAAVYGPIGFAGLRLLTCGGPFDGATGHYLDNVVVFASLVAGGSTGVPGPRAGVPLARARPGQPLPQSVPTPRSPARSPSPTRAGAGAPTTRRTGRHRG